MLTQIRQRNQNDLAFNLFSKFRITTCTIPIWVEECCQNWVTLLHPEFQIKKKHISKSKFSVFTRYWTGVRASFQTSILSCLLRYETSTTVDQENPNYLTPPSDPNLLENKGGVRYLGVLDQIWLQKKSRLRRDFDHFRTVIQRRIPNFFRLRRAILPCKFSSPITPNRTV